MVASTFTSIAVFLPLIFVVGIAGQIIPGSGAHDYLRTAGVSGCRLYADSDDPGHRSSKGV